jgi:SAM-dependent methyltransferase
LAKLVGRNGHIVGIDRSKTMIRAAQRRIQGQKCALEFHVCDAHHLKFPDNTFDACLAIGTLMFMENPSQVLTEVIRVLKPGGRLSTLESDWDSLVITAGNRAMTDTVTMIIRKSLRHSGIGHQLPVLFWQTGFKDIGVESGTLMLSDYALANESWRIEATLDEAREAGVISSAHVRRLLRQLKLASETGKFFGACTGFAVVGVKPTVC